MGFMEKVRDVYGTPNEKTTTVSLDRDPARTRRRLVGVFAVLAVLAGIVTWRNTYGRPVVPNVIGQGTNAAVAVLNHEGFDIGWSPSGDFPSNCLNDSGFVVAQSPAAGKRVSLPKVRLTIQCRDGVGGR